MKKGLMVVGGAFIVLVVIAALQIGSKALLE
jgi:hypothetical protein